MGEFHRRLIAETRALQGLSQTIDDDPAAVELAARFLAPAPTAASLLPATDRDAAVSGAAGRGLRGSGRAPASSNNDKARAVAAARASNNAG